MEVIYDAASNQRLYTICLRRLFNEIPHNSSQEMNANFFYTVKFFTFLGGVFDGQISLSVVNTERHVVMSTISKLHLKLL